MESHPAPTSVSGDRVTVSPRRKESPVRTAAQTAQTAQTAHPAVQDWTISLPDTAHVRFFRGTEWSKTLLGPTQEWPPNLRLFVRMLFADSRAACIYWGPDLVAIYNEAFMPLTGKAHPKLMGRPFRDGFPELVDAIFPAFQKAKRSGIAIDQSSATTLTVERSGWREETFFMGNFVPIGSDGNGECEGFYNPTTEVTKQVLADRRTTMLNLIASPPILDTKVIWSHVLKCLETNGKDIPLAILYEVDEETPSKGAGIQLRCHSGLPSGHALLVNVQTINSNEGLIPEFRRAGSNVMTFERDCRFDAVTWGGFGVPSDAIAIIPIASPSRLYGYLVTGTNPCRPMDEACSQFLQDLGRMVLSVVAAAVNAEESRKRQEQLENDLAFSDMKIRHLIEHASVGTVHVRLDGKIMWANDQYYVLSGRTAAESQSLKSFFEVYLDEDRPKAEEFWRSLLDGANHVSAELRLKRLYTPPVGGAEPAQIQILAFPYKEKGVIKSIMACTTDISRLKWAESWQARLAQDARDAKRQQEAFIDVVSHEMRNPLSAIVHCADSISSSLDDYLSKTSGMPETCFSAWKDNVASAEIILQCANHQRRIIDDVLTLSKLDSMLLSITPKATRPSKLVDSITTIFEAELRSHDIKTNIVPEVSLLELDIDYLYFDPSRVTQVFINLLTNAIKFVKAEVKKEIEIRFGATVSNPRRYFSDEMFWSPKAKKEVDVMANPEWGDGEAIFLTFTVSDTGIGMNSEEIRKVFERFRQANKKTHVKYGGSGLGLFISKELTEKQGGEIGAASRPGEGSTFGFYIKTRRAEKKSRQAVPLPTRKGVSTLGLFQVLLVEDNVINQQALGKQLKKAGCNVDVANHGREALTVLEEKDFDVVLMDMQMPVMDGLTATAEIRQRQSKGLLPTRLPIIAVTANVRQEQINTAIAAGADRVMQKPFKAVELVEMIKDLVLKPNS